MESYASATALISQTKDALETHKDTIMHGIVKKEGKISGRTAFEAAKQGDEVAKKVVSNYERYLADGIVSIENIFQPEIIAKRAIILLSRFVNMCIIRALISI